MESVQIFAEFFTVFAISKLKKASYFYQALREKKTWPSFQFFGAFLGNPKFAQSNKDHYMTPTQTVNNYFKEMGPSK